jgi:hypothetical protein
VEEEDAAEAPADCCGTNEEEDEEDMAVVAVFVIIVESKWMDIDRLIDRWMRGSQSLLPFQENTNNSLRNRRGASSYCT